MRRRASAEPSSRPDQVLHPSLQAALESLDVKLDEELTRYRRMRGRKPGQVERKQRDRQPDVIVLGASSAAQFPAGEALSASSVAAMASASGVIADPFADEVATSNLAAFNADLEQSLTEHQAESLEPDDYLASSEELLKSIAEEEELRAEQEPGMLESLLTPLGIGSMLLLLLSSVTFGYLIMNPNSISILGMDRWFGDRASAPAQSDAVAPTTAAAPASVLPSPNLAEQEFVDLNLNTLSTLPTGASAVPGNAPGNASGNVPGTVAPAGSPATVPSAAQGESLPTDLEQRPPVAIASTVAPSRQRTAASNSSSRSRSQAAQSGRANPAPARSTPATAARPSPSTPAPAVAPAPVRSPVPAPSVATAPAASASQGNLYHVVTEYNGDRSLEQVRQVAGDAFLRNTNEGARVQAGAFSEQSRAEELVQDLQQQGIPARIEQR